MLVNMDALLKTGQEKSAQLFGLTSQVTEENPKFMGSPCRNSQSSFLMLQCYPIIFKVFKIEFCPEIMCHEFTNMNTTITFNYQLNVIACLTNEEILL